MLKNYEFGFTKETKRIEAEKREAAAFEIIEKEIQQKDLKVENLNVLLTWHQVKLTGMSNFP